MALNTIRPPPRTHTVSLQLGTEMVGPFVTHEAIRRGDRRLAVVVDVACDVSNPNNPLPIYDRTTTFERPALRVLDGDATKGARHPPLPSPTSGHQLTFPFLVLNQICRHWTS